jgi:hypothetical protein
MSDEQNVTPEEGFSQETEATPEEGLSQDDTQTEQPGSKGSKEPFYQTKYQELVGKLKQFEGQQQEYIPPSAPLAQTEIQVDGGDDYITKADMQKMLNDVVNGVVTRTSSQLRQEQMQERYNNEYRTVNKSLEEYVGTSGAPQTVVDQARAMAQDLVPNINGMGGPSRYAKAFSYIMNNLMAEQNVGQHIKQAKSEAEQRALSAQLVQQPNGSSAGMTETPDLTNEEKVLKAMQSIGTSKIKDNIFG